MHKSRLCLAVAVLFLFVSPANAHKLKVFAMAVGSHVDGTAYFIGGGPAHGVEVSVQTPSGEPLATLQTDEDGKFAFTATRRTDQVIVVNTGDGHSARFTISAADLPESLPAAGMPAHVPPEGAPKPLVGASATGTAGVPAVSSILAVQAAVPIEDLVGQAVARQLRPLHEQINDYEDQVRLRDIVGGIGYIIGIAGLTVALRNRRREQAGR
jgi:nickel transport protein